MVILKCGCLNIDVVGRHVLLVIRFVLLLNKKFAVVAARQNHAVRNLFNDYFSSEDGQVPIHYIHIIIFLVTN